MNLEYDPIGDILYLEEVPPHAGQRTREVIEGVLTRSNTETNVIEGTEVQGFVARSKAGMLPIEIPLPGTSARMTIDYDVDSNSLIAVGGGSAVPPCVRLETLSGAYAAELAELAARGVRAPA